MANAHWPFGASGQWALTIVAYTSDTRWVKAFQRYTAKQRYTALYSIQLYIAIHYTPSTTPLWVLCGSVWGGVGEGFNPLLSSARRCVLD